LRAVLAVAAATVAFDVREAPSVRPGAIADTSAAIPAVSAAAPPIATRRVKPAR
jgi:hypothetical protein